MPELPCVVDTCSVDLEITPENKLQASVIIDPLGGLRCVDGSGLGLDSAHRATIEMYEEQIVPPSAGAGIPSVVPVFYDTAIEDTDGYIDISTGSLRFIMPLGLEGYYFMAMEERDDPLSANLDTTVGIQIRVNGVVVCSQRFERTFPTQKILQVGRMMPLSAGDIVEGYFNITNPVGATAPHPIGPGGPGFPRFLQIVRIAPE
jgi:hypothetical protein